MEFKRLSRFARSCTFLFSGLNTMHINNDTGQTSSPKNVASSAVRKLFNSGELKASHLSHET